MNTYYCLTRSLTYGYFREAIALATTSLLPSTLGTAVRQTSSPSGAVAWFMWSLLGVGYALAFLQRLAPATVLDMLMADFAVSASEIGLLSSAYFYGYMLMQLPASLFVDRFGVRRAALISLLVSGVSTVMFAHAPTFLVATAARVLVAAGDAFMWSSLIKLVTQWFPSQRFGRMSGLSQLSGFVGGLFATTPFAMLASLFGWRQTLDFVAYVIVGVFLLALLSLRDHPASLEMPSRTLGAIVVDAGRTLRRLEAWGPTLTNLGSYVVSLSLSGVWGVPFLMHVYGLTAAAASVPMFGFMLGYASGSVLFGFLSDSYFRLPRTPLLVIGVVRGLLLLLIAPHIGGELSLTTIIACMTMLGVLGGATLPLSLVCVRQIFSASNISTAIGINITIANLANGLVQPVLGVILDWRWTGMWAGPGVRRYTPAGYTGLLVTLAIISLVAVIGPLLLKRPESQSPGEMLPARSTPR